MQMTPSLIKRGYAYLNKLITGIRTTTDPFLTDFRDEKLYCISKMLSENIARSILAAQTQRQQWFKEFNTGCSLMVSNLTIYQFKKPICSRKVNPLHAVLRQCNAVHFGPTPWGLGERPKGQYHLVSIAKSISWIFMLNFVCVLTNERYKICQTRFFSVAWVMP